MRSTLPMGFPSCQRGSDTWVITGAIRLGYTQLNCETCNYPDHLLKRGLPSVGTLECPGFRTHQTGGCRYRKQILAMCSSVAIWTKGGYYLMDVTDVLR